MLRQFISDLRLPSNYFRHQQARSKAFLLLGLLVGAVTGFGMYYAGFMLAKALVGALISCIATTVVTIALFTSARASIAKWIDDIIHPIRPVTLPSVFDADKLAKRKQLIKDILDTNNGGLNPDNIKKLKTNLKEIFALRSHSNIADDELGAMVDKFHKKYIALIKEIKSLNDWEKPDIIKRLNLLAVESVLVSDALLAKVEQDIREAKQPVTTANVAKKLIDQSKRYCRNFMYSGIVDLYHRARGRVAIDINGLQDLAKFERKFYAPNTPEAMIRKVYNTFVKHGFYQNYGNKAFRERLLSRDGDQRFEHWTQVDSKKTKKFSPYPDTRPT